MNSFVICSSPQVQTDPAVAYAVNNFVVAWSDARFANGYYWLMTAAVDANGVVLDTGCCIGAQSAFNELRPDIACDGNRCLIVWYCSDQPYGIYGRFVDNFGHPEDTLLTIVKTQASNNLNPSIAFAADRYFVVWADRLPGYSDLDIFGKMVSMDGQLLGNTITIACGSVNQMYPAICSDGSQFLVVWREGTMAICGQWFDVLGTPLGNAFHVSDSTSLYRFHAGVDASPDGFLAAWSEAHNDVTDIFGRSETSTSISEIPDHIDRPSYGATIWRGAFRVSGGQRVRIYDVCGRDVTDMQLSCGIFYVHVDGALVRKIVIVE
jgi:hypothetical protein